MRAAKLARMDVKVFTPNELDAVLRALSNVANSNDRFTPGERALIEGIARLHDVDVGVDSLSPISFEEVARVVRDPQRRKRAVQLAIVMALVEGAPSEDTERTVRAFATSLELEEAGVDVLYEITHGHALMARLDMFRRVTRFIRNVDGFPGMFEFAPSLLGIGSGNPALAEKYRALGALEVGTLGRALHDHFVVNDFHFPGELKGVPLVFHDVGHVLAGYGTDPHGEIQQAAFQAGFARRDGFTFLLFGILQFHLGLRITPIARGYKDHFDVVLVMEALRRGAACKADLTHGFDVFSYKNVPVEQLRVDLEIPPLQVTSEKAALAG